MEKEFGFQLPEAYRRFLLSHNGGRPSPAYFVVTEDGEPVWMRIHFFFGIDDEIEACDLLWYYRTFERRLPRNVIAIANDEGGNLFCLDMRTRGGGRILFWDHELEAAGPEKALKLVVAKSFEGWIDHLTPRV